MPVCGSRPAGLCRIWPCVFAVLGLGADPPAERADDKWWSLQPLRQVAPPHAPADWRTTPLDAYIWAACQQARLTPSSTADPATLLRRLSFDLTGLPPTPEELDAFLGDRRPDAYERQVDRLLASPHYGERWARHWLDVARFSESQGFERDKVRPNAWRYRDYVVASFNADKPYAQFVREQLAGDLLNPVTPERIAATGFLVGGPWDEVGHLQQSVPQKLRVREDELEDMLAAVGQTFLGLTVNCARCHDHKFDPVTQVDYYRLKAALEGAWAGDRPFLTTPANLARDLEAGLATRRAKLADAELADLLARAHRRTFERRYGADALWLNTFMREPLRVTALARASGDDALTPPERFRRQQVQAEAEQQKQAAALAANKPMAYAVTPRVPGKTVVFARGDSDKPREVVSAAAPEVFGKSAEFRVSASASDAERRVKLADWIAAPTNALAARVIVNRVWHGHFGRGLVGTPNDFGFNGDRPSHPELLDWLAAEFLANGGRLKWLHKQIVMSRTFCQSSQFNERAAAVDAESKLLWRFPPRRLEGEALRDAALTVSGKLDRAVGGPSFRPFTIYENNSSFYTLVDDDRAEFNRRSLYRMIVNSARDPLLESHDCPDPSVKTPRRAGTTTPLQALILLNGTFMQRQSTALAERLRRDVGALPTAQVGRLYQLAFARQPSAPEVIRATDLIKSAGLETLCWAVLNANEFVTLR